MCETAEEQSQSPLYTNIALLKWPLPHKASTHSAHKDIMQWPHHKLINIMRARSEVAKMLQVSM